MPSLDTPSAGSARAPSDGAARPDPIKVVVVGARGVPHVEGGAEKNAEKLFPLLAGPCAITLIGLEGFAAPGTYRGIRVLTAPALRLLGTDKLAYYLVTLFHIARIRPQIVHCQGLNAAFLLLLYKALAPHVVVRYGSADYVNAKWGAIGRAGFRWCEWQLRFADAVIAVTESLKVRLARTGVPEDRITVVPNAVDGVHLDDMVGRRDQITRLGLTPGGYVLSVGRITAQKDFATLIAAFNAARARDGRLDKLVIVGGDDGSGYLQAIAAEAGPHVVFTGRMPRNELQPLYAHCRLYVNSSRHEGLSNAILEALSHDAPLIASDIEENLDLPLPSRHFFPVGDAEALARAMIGASANRDAFKVDRAAFLTWGDIAEATLRLYRRIMPRPRLDTQVAG